MDWFRWYHGSVTDPKFAIIAQRAKTTRANVVAVWSYLLETASQADKRGDVTRCDAEDVAVTLDVKTTVIDAIFDAMRSKRLIENGRLAGWDKRQPKREDNSRERTQLYRASKAPVTHCDAPVTRCDAEDTQSPPLIPKKENPPHPLKKEHPFTPLKIQIGKKTQISKRIRLLKDLTVDDELREWAREKAPDVNIDQSLDAFLDWRRSKDKQFKDYRAALRNWIRNEQKFINERKPKGSWREL